MLELIQAVIVIAVVAIVEYLALKIYIFLKNKIRK